MKRTTRPSQLRPGSHQERAREGHNQGRWTLLLVLVILAGVFFGPMLRDPPAYGTDPQRTGYPAIVADMAEKGLLSIDARSGSSAPGRVVFDTRRRDGFVESYRVNGTGGIGDCQKESSFFSGALSWFSEQLSAADKCAELFAAYRRSSFLRDDMRIDSSLIWRQEDGRLTGLAPGAHVIVDATRSFAAWQGAVDFATPYRSVMLVDVAKREILLRFDPRAPSSTIINPADRSITTTGGVVASAVVLKTGGGRCAGNVRLSLLADKVLLTLLPTARNSDCPQVFIDSTPLFSEEYGNGGFDFRLLEPGQLLTLGGKQPVVMQVVESIGALSALDDRKRRYEPTLAQIGGAIAIAEPTQENLLTSIRPELHFAAQAQLEGLAVRELAGERSSFRAGAILIDALSGEIAAMPSFPLRETHLVSADRMRSTRLEWLSQNQNLVPLPAGSTAKVPLATAIADAYPDLLTLRTPAQMPGFSSVLGDRLLAGGDTLEDNVGGAAIDFETFIAKSSNYYAVLLMRLAAGEDPMAQDGNTIPPGQRYSIGGRQPRNAPKLPPVGGSWGYRWADELWRIACVPAYTKGPGSSAGWWQIDPQGCPRYYIDTDKVANPVRLGAIAHNTPRLEFDRVEQPDAYRDYYMSILGQNRGSWTNAALIQAYARIVTNRRVALRFDRKSSRDDDFASLDLDEQVWSTVMAGLRGAAETGTARRLEEELGERFGGVSVYAKTGTPTLDRVPGQGEAVEQGHAIVVAFVRYSAGTRTPDSICSARMVAVNIEDRDGAERAPALDLVLELARRPIFARWLAAPCPRNPDAAQPIAPQNVQPAGEAPA